MMNDFDEIRPYRDDELPQVYEELIADEMFRRVMAVVMPGVPFEAIAQQMRACRTVLEFQKTFCYPLLKKIMKEATLGTTLDISLLADRSRAYTYVSNHRDIVLDSGFLSVLLVDAGLSTVEIAIGDNLLSLPWVKELLALGHLTELDRPTVAAAIREIRVYEGNRMEIDYLLPEGYRALLER